MIDTIKAEAILAYAFMKSKSISLDTVREWGVDISSLPIHLRNVVGSDDPELDPETLQDLIKYGTIYESKIRNGGF